jgi:hypothetical protein
MSGPTYLMSFGAGALLYRESITVSELHGELADWDAVRASVIAENRLQLRTMSAAKRVYREASARLQTLTPAELEVLRDGSRTEQGYVLWLAICKRYRFIHDFAVEVVRERVLRLNFSLAYEDFDVFYRTQAEWHPEVANIEPSTRAKLRQVLFRMMREAEILSREDRILPAILTPQLVAAIRQDAPALLASFPVSEAELKGWLQ